MANSIEELLNQKELRENIEYIHRIAGSAGKTANFPDNLLPEIKAVLQQRGITSLYSHQAEAWQYAENQQDFAVVTPTASGKTLTYNLPVLQEMINHPSSKALYLFPTKALSQDQMNEIHELITLLEKDIKVYTFDGDTPANARQAIRKQGNIVVTNPDMLHQGIMPHHTKWMQFFQNLKFVVIDEMHIYRGVFGSHMTNVIRRLRRLCKFYRSDPLFILCSATIANPKEHAEKLIEKPVQLIDQSGAPLSPKTIYFYNPPVVNKELGIRASYIKQTRYLANLFIQKKIQTIVFALSRLNVEVLTKYLKDDFESNREALSQPEKIAGYRGGYLPNRRREIEKGIREGTIRGVISTNALELGIDIGSLDATILAGYPGSIASTWQQFGRAGRSGQRAYGIFVARSNPVDQFLMKYPDYFFSKSPEHARINPDNLMILVDHIKCAAFELPFEVDETFGTVGWEDLKEILKFLVEGGILHRSGDRWYWSENSFPAAVVNLRSFPEGNFVVVNTNNKNKILGEVDYSSAAETIFPGAIYLFSGSQYIVDKLDWDGRKAYVRKTDSDYYTESITNTRIKILTDDEQKSVGYLKIHSGEVQVLKEVTGYKKIKFYTMENAGYGNINLPNIEMATTSYWFTIPQNLLNKLSWSRYEIIDGIRGISRALHYVASIKIMCEINDIQHAIGDKSSNWFIKSAFNERSTYNERTVYTINLKNEIENIDLKDLDLFQPTIFIYDNYPGGIGFTPLLYDSHEELLKNTLKLISTCACPDGCPSCVGPKLEVGEKSKQIAIEILSLITK